MTHNLDHATETALWTELRQLIGELGSNGGEMSPSVYESAQVLRLYPQAADEEAVVRWLLAQQNSDGGWGGTGALMYREVPTLAAVLALHQSGRAGGAGRAAQRGLAFLQRRAHHWRDPIPHTIPVGFELIWPRLVSAAEEAGLALPIEEYAVIFALGERKRELIERLNPGPNTPAVFSWEAWGTVPDPRLVDEEGGVAASSAATAAWLRAAGHDPALQEARRFAESYLQRAAMATPYKIPGLMPTAWPMELMEQSFALHALLLADLLNREELHDVVRPRAEELYRAISLGGIGFNRRYLADGDDTAAGLAVLAAYGYPVSASILAPFEHATHFSGYPFEFHSAPVVITARAVHALRICGNDVAGWQESIISSQHVGGLWEGDKWNTSRLYVSCIALVALRGAPYPSEKALCRKALIAAQRRGCAWGSGARATIIETAFAVLGLYTLACDDMLDDAGWRALWRGHQVLLAQWQTRAMADEKLWICKELYSPRRIDHTFVLAAILAPCLLP